MGFLDQLRGRADADELYRLATSEPTTASERIDELTAYLESEDSDERATAAVALSELAYRDASFVVSAFDDLVAALDDEPSIREDVSAAVGWGASAVPTTRLESFADQLATAMEASGTETKSNLLKAFTELTSRSVPVDKTVCDEAAGLLYPSTDATSLASTRACQFFSIHADSDPESARRYFDKLLAAAETPIHEDRATCLVALLRVARTFPEDDAVPDVIELVKDSFGAQASALRRKATMVAGELLSNHPDRFVGLADGLVDKLDDQDALVREQAGLSCATVAAAHPQVFSDPSTVRTRLEQLDGEIDYGEHSGTIDAALDDLRHGTEEGE